MSKLLGPLSPELETARTNLEIALHVPVPATWDEAEAYLRAAQPASIGEALVETLFPELDRARFAYLFRKEMTKGGDRVQLGHALKVPAKWSFLAELDFLIEFNWTMWRQLQPAQRVALVDHELCHCGKDVEHDKYVLIHHDVEEFGGVVRRWGLWKQDLQLFSNWSAGEGAGVSTDLTITVHPHKEHRMYRQGDVLLIPMAAPTALTPIAPIDGRLILARGEVTGHHHSVAARPGSTLQLDEGGVTYLTLERLTQLEHQEHAPIAVPAGTYQVRRQREYAPEEIRTAAD